MRLDEATDRFVDYYVGQAKQQRGNGQDSITYFAGPRYQRGHGIRAIFTKIRAALPSFIKKIGLQALKTGLNVADDMLSGRKFGTVIGPRAYDGIKTVAKDIFLQNQSGSGVDACDTGYNNQRGLKRKRKQNKTKKKSTKCTRACDIFTNR